MQRDYDIIVWGATGFTGKLVTRYMEQNYIQGNLKWAVAGRNKSKLNSLGLSEENILIADSDDQESIDQLVQNTSDTDSSGTLCPIW